MAQGGGHLEAGFPQQGRGLGGLPSGNPHERSAGWGRGLQGRGTWESFIHDRGPSGLARGRVGNMGWARGRFEALDDPSDRAAQLG